ncbi:MAG: hypothetical protein WBG82_09925 [Parvibaculum sp.]|uniref:hypothetical protein n=1 Tax=Parvibaculum sp. TaxID=2024848 RepID=UPI003C784C64
MRIGISSLAVLSLILVAGCASDGARSGVGLSGAAFARVEPSRQIGSGPLAPQSLVGVAPEALSARLGAPDFRRVEPGAEVWQYAGGACNLFVYFYKTDADVLASSYVDARKREGGAADPNACLAGVLTKRNVPVS